MIIGAVFYVRYFFLSSPLSISSAFRLSGLKQETTNLQKTKRTKEKKNIKLKKIHKECGFLKQDLNDTLLE